MPHNSGGCAAIHLVPSGSWIPSSGDISSESWVCLRWPSPSVLIVSHSGSPGLLVPHNDWVCPLPVRWWWHTRGQPYVLLYWRWGLKWGAGQDHEQVTPSSYVPLCRRGSQHWTALHYQSTLAPITHRLWHSPHSMALTNMHGGHHSNMEGVWFWCCCLLGCHGHQSRCWCCSWCWLGDSATLCSGAPFLV